MFFKDMEASNPSTVVYSLYIMENVDSYEWPLNNVADDDTKLK